MNQELLFDFLNSSKTNYHAVDYLRRALLGQGYTELYENEHTELASGGKYFYTRGGASIIAFRNIGGAFAVAATHSDSPMLRVKCGSTAADCKILMTERYGGMVNHTWLDRPLAVSGICMVHTEGALVPRLFTLPSRVTVPGVAIHLNRDINDKASFNPAKDLNALYALGTGATLMEDVADTLGVDKADIISSEIYLSSAETPCLIGRDNAFILSPRLDDLACVYSAYNAFIAGEGEEGNMCPIFAVFDNEEVGSETNRGAASSFLRDVLYRISGGEAEYQVRLGESFMISADNAHACHPNHPELSDANFAPTLGGGVVVKHNSAKRYATDAESEGVFLSLCKGAGVKCSHYYNRADIPGGSTLGSISSARVAMPTVDIGIAQLSMHSICESMALCDIDSMEQAIAALYRASIKRIGNKIILF